MTRTKFALLLACALVQACATGGYANSGAPCAMEPAENRCARQWLKLVHSLEKMDTKTVDVFIQRTKVKAIRPDISVDRKQGLELQLALANNAKGQFRSAATVLSRLPKDETDLGMVVKWLSDDIKLHSALGTQLAGQRKTIAELTTERDELQQKLEQLSAIEERLNRRAGPTTGSSQ